MYMYMYVYMYTLHVHVQVGDHVLRATLYIHVQRNSPVMAALGPDFAATTVRQQAHAEHTHKGYKLGLRVVSILKRLLPYTGRYKH